MTKRLCTILLAAIAMLWASAGHAAEFTTTVSQAAGANWTQTIWNPGAVSPVAGNNYSALANGTAFANGAGNTRLRSPTTGGLTTFPGDMLTMNTNTEIRFKTGTGQILNFPGVGGNPGLVLNGGCLNAGDAVVFTINGNVRVDATSVLDPGNPTFGPIDTTREFIFNATLSGSGALTLESAGLVLPLDIRGTNNPFSGDWLITSGYLKGTGPGSLGSGNIVIGYNKTFGNAALNACKFEPMYNINNPNGNLSISNNSTMVLHQNLTFKNLFINGTQLAPEVYSFAQLSAAYPSIFGASGSGSITVLPAGPAPTGLAATSGDTQVGLSWNLVIDANTYVIQRSTSASGPFTRIATNASTSYVDTAVVNGTTYYYTVRAQFAVGESSSSSQVSATPNPPPDVPTGLSTVNGDTAVTVTWSAAARATSYNVKRSLVPGGPYTTVRTTSATSVVDSGLVNGTTYYYVVSAVNGAGESADSTEVSGRPSEAPAGLTAVGGANQVSLNWSSLAGATSYNVKRALNTGGPYSPVATGVSGTSYLDTGLNNGTIYYYVVSGQVGPFESGNSAEASALTTLSTPTGLVPTVTSNALRFTVNLAWTDPDPAVTAYKIERSSDGINFSQVGTSPTRSFGDSTVSPSFTFYYRVRASVGSANSDYSGVVSAAIPTLSAFVNFSAAVNNSAGTPTAPIPDGYVQDVGEVYGLRTNNLTYGWSADNTLNGRYRVSGGVPQNPDLRLATFNHLQKQTPAYFWEIALPTGAYKVILAACDAGGATDVTYATDLEGVLSLYSGTATITASLPYFGTNTISVVDGRLTVSCNALAANNKVAYIDIVSVPPQPPLIVTQPVASTTANENDTVSLAVVATGTAPISYQWYKDGNLLNGQTTATLTLVDVQLAAAGTYSVTLSNFVGTAASSGAVLTVNPDNTKPTIVSVSGDATYTNVLVNFSERVTAATANNLANYFIATTSGGDPLAISSAALLGNNKTVRLVTAAQTPGTQYTLTVNNIADISPQANTIVTDSQKTFTAWIGSGCMLLVETFTGITGTDVASLTNNAKYINNTPDIVGYLTSFSYAPNLDNYGSRVSGFFIPPSNGVYRFYIRSDDASMLFLNPAGADPAGKLLVAREDSCCHAYGYSNTSYSADYPMTAGQRYYIESLQKEGIGGDYVQVAFREQGDPSIPPSAASSTPVGSEVASGTFFSTLANPDVASLSLGVTPANPQITENDSLTLTAVIAYGPTNFPVCIQWQRYDGNNYIDIPGATGTTYNTGPLGLNDDSAVFRASVTIPGASAVSDVTVHVTTDLTAPTIVSIGSLDGNVIGVVFSEAVKADQVVDPFAWWINGETDDYLTITSIGFSADMKTAYLTNSYTIPGDTITVKIYELHDLAANENVSYDVRAAGRIEHFTATDVGVPGVDPITPGSIFVGSSNTFKITGGGSDIWNNSNAMNFVYKQVNGDFDVRVRVESLDPVNVNSKAGLVATETLDPGSRNVNVVADPSAVPTIYGAATGANLIEANFRAVANQASAQWPIGGRKTGVPYPNAWLRMTRQANTFVAYHGTNGSDWYAFATNAVTPSYPSSLYLGMAVTSHDNAPGHTANALLHDWLLVSKPSLSAGGFSGGSFQVSLATEFGVTYVIEYKDSIDAASWTFLGTVVGDGTVKTVSDPGPAPSTRFYRSRVQ